MFQDVSFIERRVLDSEPGTTVSLSRAEVEHLLSDPAYRHSLGQPARDLHYRKSLPGGGGLHLVIRNGRGELHRDLHDPHAGLQALGRHLASESPREWLSVLSAGGALLRRLGARSRPPDRTGGSAGSPEGTGGG